MSITWVWITHDKIGKNVAVRQLHFSLILNTINPQILDLATLRFERLQTSGEAKKVLDEYNREREERLNEFIKRGEVSLTSENAAKDFARECRNRGGTSSSIRKDVDQEALQNCLRYNVREGSCQVQSFARYFVRCTK